MYKSLTQITYKSTYKSEFTGVGVSVDDIEFIFRSKNILKPLIIFHFPIHNLSRSVIIRWRWVHSVSPHACWLSSLTWFSLACHVTCSGEEMDTEGWGLFACSSCHVYHLSYFLFSFAKCVLDISFISCLISSIITCRVMSHPLSNIPLFHFPNVFTFLILYQIFSLILSFIKRLTIFLWFITRSVAYHELSNISTSMIYQTSFRRLGVFLESVIDGFHNACREWGIDRMYV